VIKESQENTEIMWRYEAHGKFFDVYGKAWKQPTSN